MCFYSAKSVPASSRARAHARCRVPACRGRRRKEDHANRKSERCLRASTEARQPTSKPDAFFVVANARRRVGVARRRLARPAPVAAGSRVSPSSLMSGVSARHARSDFVLPQPASPKYHLVHIGFTSPGGPSRNKDKDCHGHRYDSVGICNGVIHAGASCVRFVYDPNEPERMAEALRVFDGYIVRINPGQLSNPGVKPGAQGVFDALMRSFVSLGKPVWSSPAVQKAMGGKDALVKIKDLSCGLPDTRCYYDAESFERGFRETAACHPRVLKRNRGSAGEGVWLVWLADRSRYCANVGDRLLEDSEVLELMEMCDNHVERHTVREFIEFCVRGADGEGAGIWCSNHPGGFFSRVDTAPTPSHDGTTRDGTPSHDGTTRDAVHVVDQRLLPRITEGEVRLLMVRDSVFQIIHKKPRPGGMSAVGTLIESPTFYEPDCGEYEDLRRAFIEKDLPSLKTTLGLEGEPLPLIWTADFIPRDHSTDPSITEWIVGEFNCSCVGVSPFLAAAGAGKSLADVSDEDYVRGMRLCDLMGEHVVNALDERKRERETAR